MKLIILATEVYEELSSPDDISPSSVTTWLATNLGQLNSLLLTSYDLTDDSSEITPELGVDEKAIFKKIYIINYYSRQIRSNLGAAAYTLTSVEEDGFKVVKANRNEIAKTFMSLKRAEMDELQKFLLGYKSKRGGPLAVHSNEGVDTYINPNNPYWFRGKIWSW